MMPPWSRQLRDSRTLGWGMTLALVAAGLTLVPLFDLLAFEFCFALGLVAAFAGGHLGARTVALARRADDSLLWATRSAAEVLRALVARAVFCSWLLLLPPLLLISANALRVPNCNYLRGLAFFALLPLLSAAIAAGCGVIWGLALRRPWLASGASLATIALSIGWGVYRFYAEPPICGYDPFAGYFPGTLYDELVAVRPPLLWARAYHLAWLGFALAASAALLDSTRVQLSLRRPRPRSLVPAALLLAVALPLTWYRGELGFAVDARTIERELGGIRQTEHFTIFHPRELPADAVAALAADHEFRYAQLARALGVAPPRIRSFIFRGAEQKKRLLGAGSTFIAKPWRGEIYLQHEAFPHRVLKHELAHVFAGTFGDPLFHVSVAWRRGVLGLPLPHFNVGLIEGLAVAVDNRPAGELTLHQQAALLLRSGLAPPLKALFGLRFLTFAGRRSYVLAGSFCRFLLQRHGAPKLRRLYRSAGDFGGVYGHPLPELAKAWRAMLGAIELPAAQLELAREAFRRPSIFRRVCVHELARLRRRAAALAARGEHRRALELQRRICAHDPGDPRNALTLLELLDAVEGPATAAQLRYRLLAHPALTAPLRRQVLIRLGDLHWRQRATALAAADYTEADALPAGPGGRRALWFRRWALARAEPSRSALLDYLIRSPLSPERPVRDLQRAYALRRAGLPPALADYLLGKQLALRELPAAAAAALERALRAGLPTADLTGEALLVLGRSAFAAGQLTRATAAFCRLQRQPAAAGGRAQLAGDWLRRVFWRRTGALPTREQLRRGCRAAAATRRTGRRARLSAGR